MKNPKVKFFIIGAQKGGTTSVLHHLNFHPSPKPMSDSEFKYLHDFYKKPNTDLFNFLGYKIEEWK